MAEEAAKLAISSPLLETSINGAKGVLVNITCPMDFGMEEVDTAANMVQEAVHPDANIIFGSIFDNSLEDEICVTVIATGFEELDGGMPAKPFTAAGEKRAGERQRAGSASAVLPSDEDPFDGIFEIFNKKKGGNSF